MFRRKPPAAPKGSKSADDVASSRASSDEEDNSDGPSRAATSDDVFQVYTGNEPGAETVQVVVRMRPFNTKEKSEKRGPCVELDYALRQVRR